MNAFTNYTPVIKPSDLSAADSKRATARREHYMQNGTPAQRQHASGFMPGIGKSDPTRADRIKRANSKVLDMAKSKFDQFQPGMVVYDAHKVRAGNTTMMTLGVWRVRIIEVDREKQTILASWNGNTPETMYRRSWSKLRLKAPLVIKNAWTTRLATREEIKAGLGRAAA